MLTVLMRSSYQNKKYEQSKKQYELDRVSRLYENVTSKLSHVQDLYDGNKSQLAKNSAYEELQSLQQTYDVKKEELEQDLQKITADLDSYQDAIKSSTENSNKWNLIA